MALLEFMERKQVENPHPWTDKYVRDLWDELWWAWTEAIKEIEREVVREFQGADHIPIGKFKWFLSVQDADGVPWLRVPQTFDLDNPDEYYQHIYGEDEVGGTSVLFLAPAKVAALGFDKLGNDPLPSLTWDMLSKIPGFIVMGGAALSAFWWITRRRNEVALYEAAHRAAHSEVGHAR